VRDINVLKRLDSIDLLAFALLGVGFLLFAWGWLLEPPDSTGDLVIQHYGDWTPGLVIDAVLLLVLNRIIRQHERRRVISQVGSLSNEFALDAVRRCRDEGWLRDGTMARRRYAKAKLADADLSDAMLAGADFSFADLSNCTLTHADLRHASLRGANLCGADLRWAKFGGAVLEWADLRGAHLDGAELADTTTEFASIDPEHAERPEFAGAMVGGFLTDRQQQLVQSTFKLLLDKGDAAIVRFYDRLFEAAPHFRPMFSGDMQHQARKFLQSLKVIVSSLARTERAVPVLQRLGERHRGYGVAADHYRIAGSVLIATLDDVLEDAFTDEVRIAWTEAYRLIASIMGGRVASTRPGAEPPPGPKAWRPDAAVAATRIRSVT
jgi:hemoglobin-like flavoprotein